MIDIKELKEQLDTAKGAISREELSVRAQVAIAEQLERIAVALEASNSTEEFRDNVNLYTVKER